MRGVRTIARATALEVLSEPLTLLVLLAALVLTVLAPAFHCHQFGEPTRMARDAGLSSLLVGGAVTAVFGTIRAFRREIESGTMEMALAHPVSRGGFFFAKALGAAGAYLVFALIVVGVTLTMVDGASIGGALAMRNGGLARVWGPRLVAGVGVMTLPIVVAAALNRFGRFRFVLSSFALASVLSLASAAVAIAHDRALALRLLPVIALIALMTLVFLSVAAAFAIRAPAHAAAAATGAVVALALPAVGNYYLSDALANGGSVPWSYVALAAGAALPALLLFGALGLHFIGKRDVE